MNKKKCAISALCLLCAIGVGKTAYHHFNSKTSDEYAEDFIKDWMRFLNKKDEIAFNVKGPGQEPQELINKWGTFLVRVKEVRPCLDGYKITFSVRNLSDIAFPNPKVKLRWTYARKEYDSKDILEMPKEYHSDWSRKYEKEMADWSSSFKEKKFSNLKALEAKSWTDLEFTVLPCKPNEFEHVEFSIIG